MNKKAYISPASELITVGIDCPILAASGISVHDEGGDAPTTLTGNDTWSNRFEWGDDSDAIED